MASIDPTAAARWARRAEDLAAIDHHPIMRTEVLAALTRYCSVVGDAARGVECAQEALALAEQFHQTRAIHSARNALAILAARGGLDDPVPVIRAAVAEAYTDRAWYDLWPTMPVLAAMVDRTEPPTTQPSSSATSTPTTSHPSTT